MTKLAIFAPYIHLGMFAFGQVILVNVIKPQRNNAYDRPMSRIDRSYVGQYATFHYWRGAGTMVLTLGMLLMARSTHETFQPIRWAGMVIIVFGTTFSLWAHYTLGRSWAGSILLAENHRLVTNGPYRWVRHPLYTGMLVGAFGVCLATLDVLTGLGSIIYTTAYALRYPHEEALLRKKYKKQYEGYARDRGALLPKLRRS